MRDLVSTFFKVLIVIIVVGIVVNEVGNVLYSYYQGSEIATQVASVFADKYNATGNTTIALNQAQLAAQQSGVQIEKYQINNDNQTVEVVISLPVEHTLIIANVKQLDKLSRVYNTGEASITKK